MRNHPGGERYQIQEQFSADGRPEGFTFCVLRTGSVTILAENQSPSASAEEELMERRAACSSSERERPV